MRQSVFVHFNCFFEFAKNFQATLALLSIYLLSILGNLEIYLVRIQSLNIYTNIWVNKSFISNFNIVVPVTNVKPPLSFQNLANLHPTYSR